MKGEGRACWSGVCLVISVVDEWNVCWILVLELGFFHMNC